MIEHIVRTMTEFRMHWTVDQALVELPRRGLRLTDSAGKRYTFQDERSLRYSSYFRERGDIGFVEATLAVFPAAELLSDLDYQHVVDEFSGRFDEVQDKVASTLGRGRAFSLTTGDEFPHERDAIRLTLWKLPTADLMLELRHEDRELPIRLVLTLAPPEGRTS